MANYLVKPGLAKKIQNARHAGAAKAMSKDIADEATRNEWELSKGIDIMKELACEKCNQCPAFINCIYENKNSIFAEATPSKIWASGMSEYVTQNTTPANWIGQNLLGCIMNDIAKIVDKIFENVMNPDGVKELFEEMGFQNANTTEKKDNLPSAPADFNNNDSKPISQHEKSQANAGISTSSLTSDDILDLSHIDDDGSEKVPLSKDYVPKEVPFSFTQKPIPEQLKKIRTKARRHSIAKTDDLDPFLVYLDVKYEEITKQKRKELDSSPEKDSRSVQDIKCAKVGVT